MQPPKRNILEMFFDFLLDHFLNWPGEVQIMIFCLVLALMIKGCEVVF